MSGRTPRCICAPFSTCTLYSEKAEQRTARVDELIANPSTLDTLATILKAMAMRFNIHKMNPEYEAAQAMQHIMNSSIRFVDMLCTD